jgi:hypothetical protein
MERSKATKQSRFYCRKVQDCFVAESAPRNDPAVNERIKVFTTALNDQEIFCTHRQGPRWMSILGYSLSCDKLSVRTSEARRFIINFIAT